MYIIQDMRLTFVLLDTKLNGCEGKCFSRFFILCSAIALHYYTDAPVRKCQDVRVKEHMLIIFNGLLTLSRRVTR